MFKINYSCKPNIYLSIKCNYDKHRIAKCKNGNKKE